MKVPLEILDAARSDLRDHATYVGRGNIGRETLFLQAALKTFEFLSENPGAGALYEVDDPAIPALRKWAIKGWKNYLVFYRDEGAKLEIVRVLHAARNLPDFLRDR